jgi:hypothetical protein
MVINWAHGGRQDPQYNLTIKLLSFFQGIVMSILVLHFKLRKFLSSGFVQIQTHLNGLRNYWKVLKRRLGRTARLS